MTHLVPGSKRLQFIGRHKFVAPLAEIELGQAQPRLGLRLKGDLLELDNVLLRRGSVEDCSWVSLICLATFDCL